ncbi:MAG: polyprenol monophosphomannose synthase [Dehalococcoidia bacterium]|nr:polyprenol monophosphomannose synthase [Dehalococcoidia bacterium]
MNQWNEDKMVKTSIIVPTYQERENIPPLVKRIDQAMKDQAYEIIVVDDDSPDGTAEVAESLAGSYPIRVIKRKGVRGLGSAILTGFREGTGEILGVIDADLQHPPEILAGLVNSIQSGADIAIASRYVRGGGVQGWSSARRIISKGATLLARPVTSVKDPMSGCFMLTRTTFATLNLNSEGYKVLLEILAQTKSCKVEEIPYTFECRRFGTSKLNWKEYIRYLQLLKRLYLIGSPKQAGMPENQSDQQAQFFTRGSN